MQAVEWHHFIKYAEPKLHRSGMFSSCWIAHTHDNQRIILKRLDSPAVMDTKHQRMKERARDLDPVKPTRAYSMSDDGEEVLPLPPPPPPPPPPRQQSAPEPVKTSTTSHPDEEDVIDSILQADGWGTMTKPSLTGPKEEVEVEEEDESATLQSFRDYRRVPSVPSRPSTTVGTGAETGTGASVDESSSTHHDFQHRTGELGLQYYVRNEIGAYRILKTVCPFILRTLKLVFRQEPGAMAYPSLYLAMEYCSKGTFGDQMSAWNVRAQRFFKKYKPFVCNNFYPAPESSIELLHMVGCCLRALEYAHGRGVLHRDIKEDNILLRDDGMYVLGDWGVAYTGPPADPKDTCAIALHRRPPELRFKSTQYDDKVDIFALGIILLTTLTKFKYDDKHYMAIQELVDMFPHSMTQEDVDWICSLSNGGGFHDMVIWPTTPGERKERALRDCMAHPILEGKSLLESLMKDMCHPHPAKRLNARALLEKYPYLGTDRVVLAQVLRGAEMEDRRRGIAFDPRDRTMQRFYNNTSALRAYMNHRLKTSEDILCGKQ